MTLHQTQKEKILSALKYAIEQIYARDEYLIENQVHERSIVNRFCIYFQEALNRSSYSFLHLDSEYNKDHSDSKRTLNFPNGTYPDVIVHQRGSNDFNLCIIEFKTWWNDYVGDDIRKLQDFTSQREKYKYGIGFSIVLNRHNASIQMIEDGQVFDNHQLLGYEA